MTKATYLTIVGLLILALVPVVPNILNLRIRVLRFLRWNSLADWHERHVAGLIVGVRITLAIVGLIVLTIGLLQF
ncbi:MAG: hypothetical protein RBT76_13225 [candidate division Zixibacteria bacterium]|jgi:hypothetical protein|nr:hypothetical protein [candidate division Zixibacteria bacterium]